MASPPFALPPLAPSDCDPARPRVRILHPGYKQNYNVLLTFSTCDIFPDPTSQDRTLGLHHRTALTAGAIIANNAFDRVYFSHDQLGKNDIKTPREGILEPGYYYLQVRRELLGNGEDTESMATDTSATPSSSSESTSMPLVNNDYNYPIVPTFEDWQFPHGNLPPGWDEKRWHQFPEEARCYLTEVPFALQDCHIIPSGASDWFDSNGMFHYCDHRECLNPIDDSANTLMLNSEVRSVFDKGMFVIVPKPSTHSPDSNPPSTSTASPVSTAGSILTADHQPHELTIHVLSTDDESARQFAKLYHNRAIKSKYFGSVSGEFLFARFAWAIFSLLQKFLNFKIDRRLLVTVDGKVKPKLMNSKQFEKYLDERKNQAGSRKRRYDASAHLTQRPYDDDEHDAYAERWIRRNASRFPMLMQPSMGNTIGRI